MADALQQCWGMKLERCRRSLEANHFAADVPRAELIERRRQALLTDLFFTGSNAVWKTPCRKTGYCADCKSPDRICNTWTITEKAFPKGRISVVLINADLGL